MVFGDVAADDLDIVGTANLTDEVADPRADCSREDGFAILGRPDQVVAEVKEGMRCSAIELHIGSISS